MAPIARRTERALLGAILLLFAAISCIGITWGLPSRDIDPYLFGDEAPWAGEKIYRLAGAADKLSADAIARRGADVDLDPLRRSDDEPVLLTGTDEDVARILLRYRLYTYQPDEMITMMALAGMRPRELKLDPRLYQYGGLFIYPVGGLIGAAGVLGLIDVRSDVVYYLDNPDEFGRFYVVARAYAAVWGLVGVLAVFAIGRRLGGSRVGLLAALLFTLMPVVVCMAHEGKPHLPGAVLMLLAVLFAMRHLRIGQWQLESVVSHPPQPPLVQEGEEEGQPAAGDASRVSIGGAPAGDTRKAEHAHASRGHATLSFQISRADRSRRDWWLMCVCCGASFGMVLSSLPIFVLIPVIAWMELRRDTGFGSNANRAGQFFARTIMGVGVGALVYLVTNPYVAINVIANREVLRSNFGNSLAMYEIDRIAEGFVRVLQLTVEGATLPLVVLGALALLVALLRGGHISTATVRERPQLSERNLSPWTPRLAMLPLAVPAAVFFVQFVLIGAGKPGEYGRFGVFTNTALAIGTACLLARPWIRLREVVNWLPAMFAILWCGFFGVAYLSGFRADCGEDASRLQAGRVVRAWKQLGEQIDGSESISYLEKCAVCAEPAPYGCPPLPFGHVSVYLFDSCKTAREVAGHPDNRLVYMGTTDQRPLAVDRGPIVSHRVFPERRLRTPYERFRYAEVQTVISWANKPFEILRSDTLQVP